MPNPEGVSHLEMPGSSSAAEEGAAKASLSKQLQEKLQVSSARDGELPGGSPVLRDQLLSDSLVLLAQSLDDWRSQQELHGQEMIERQRRAEQLLESLHGLHAQRGPRVDRQGSRSLADALADACCELTTSTSSRGMGGPSKLPWESEMMSTDAPLSDAAQQTEPPACRGGAELRISTGDGALRPAAQCGAEQDVTQRVRFAPVGQPVAGERDETDMSVDGSASGDGDQTEGHEIAEVVQRRRSWRPSLASAPSRLGFQSKAQLGRMSSEVVLDDARAHWTFFRTASHLGAAVKASTPPDDIMLKIVTSKFYELLMLLMIVMNAIFIGFQVQDAAAALRKTPTQYEQPLLFDAIETIFLIAFLFEWFTRVLAYRAMFFKGADASWNLFDTSVLLFMVLEQIEKLFAGSDMPLSQVAASRMLRAVRVMRAMRVLRALRFLAGLRVLLQTVVIALKSMIWTSVVVLALLYMFGVIFTQGTVDYCSYATDCLDHPDLLVNFGSVDRSLVSLFQTMTSGVAWRDLLFQLEALPKFYYVLFIMYVAVAYFAILNVVTGIFVETTLQVAQVDREDIINEEVRGKEAYMQKAHQIFVDMDKDGSNSLTLDELKDAVKDRHVTAYLNAMELDFTDVATLFVLLDRDQSGSVNLDEFLRGCMRLKGEAKSLDIAKIQYELEWLMHNMNFLLDTIARATVQHVSEEPSEACEENSGIQRRASMGSLFPSENSECQRNESKDSTHPECQRIRSKVKQDFLFHQES